MTGVEIALAHASLGRRVFPYRRVPQADGHAKKIPVVKWTIEATSDLDQVARLWRGKSRLPAGWYLEEGLVVVDIDDERAFPNELDLPVTASQGTQRGVHLLYRVADGRSVPQVNEQARGFDTRVGERGWVALYGLGSFDGEVADAPEWLYDLRATAANPVTDEPISSRSEILSLAGRLRWAGLSGDEIGAVLEGRLADGRVYSSREDDPWTEEQLARIASDFGQKPVGEWHYEEQPAGFVVASKRSRRRYWEPER